MTPDPRLAALTEAMELHFRPPDAPPGGSYTMETYRRDAAAILGERGVFLPDGAPDYVAKPFVFCPYCGQRLAVIFDAHRCGTSDID